MVDSPSAADPGRWDQRYREGGDGWELGRPAPPLAAFLQEDDRAPRPPGRVLVPGCGRGHEAALLEACGFSVVGLDFSGEALRQARRFHGDDRPTLRWLQADLFDPGPLARGGLETAGLDGVVEHTCFCAVDPGLRQAYAATVARLLRPGGWFLGLFWCHGREGGPPWGADPTAVAALFAAAGLAARVWEPARGSVEKRQGEEWLGLWARPAAASA